MKTTACILLLMAAAWAQQVAVPQGGSLGPSCNLSDAATLGADQVDGSHASTTPGANTVPASDSNGKLAPGWIPLPTASSIGGIFMDADCLAGNHVTGIDAATGRLMCSADAAEWGNIGNKPSVFPPDTGSQAWVNLLGMMALKAPAADAALTGTTRAEELVATKFSGRVGAGPAVVDVSFLGSADSDPSGACTSGMLWKATASSGTKQFRCVDGAWVEDAIAGSALGDPGANGVIKRTAQNTTAVAGYADIVSTWTSCVGDYLRKDGTCGDPVASANATQIQSNNVVAGVPGDGKILKYRSATSRYDLEFSIAQVTSLPASCDAASEPVLFRTTSPVGLYECIGGTYQRGNFTGTALTADTLGTGSTGAWQITGSYGSLTTPAAGKSTVGFGSDGELQEAVNGSSTFKRVREAVRKCEVHIWGSGTSQTLQDTDDEPASCYNSYGQTWTITAVRCWADAGSPTITPIITGGAADSILTGALTCGTASWAAGTLNGTPTLGANGTLDLNITAAGGTAKHINIVIEGTI